jgi:hypothetical protein
MAQCHGMTKSGERCKRDANEGSEYCGFHGDQAETTTDEASGGGGRSADRPTDLILVGAVAVALFALRRVLKLF